jgi:hypothetical protein
MRGPLTIALAAVVVVLLSVHRAGGPGRLARATAEYAVVALLAALLALAGGLDQPRSNPTGSAATTEAKQAAGGKPNLQADDEPGVLRVAAAVTRAVTKAIRAVTGAVGWLVDLWRQAEAKVDRADDSPATTTPKGEAMPPSPALASMSTRRLL